METIGNLLALMGMLRVNKDFLITSLKLTAKAPENRGPLEKEIPIENHHF